MFHMTQQFKSLSSNSFFIFLGDGQDSFENQTTRQYTVYDLNITSSYFPTMLIIQRHDTFFRPIFFFFEGNPLLIQPSQLEISTSQFLSKGFHYFAQLSHNSKWCTAPPYRPSTMYSSWMFCQPQQNLDHDCPSPCRMQECEGVSFSTSYHGIKQLLSLLTSQHPSITFYLFHSSRFTAGFFDIFFFINKMKLKFVYGWPTKRLGFEDPRFMVGCQAEISCKCRKAAKCLKCQLFHFTACD